MINDTGKKSVDNYKNDCLFMILVEVIKHLAFVIIVQECV